VIGISPTPSGNSLLRTQIAVIAVVAIYGITNGFVGPLVSLRLEAAMAGSTIIGLAAAASAFGTLIVSPHAPRLMARLGLVPIIAFALVADAVLILALNVFDSLYAWLVLRMLMGVSIACLFIASETWISALANDRNRGRVMGVYNAVLSLSFGLGPLIIVTTGTEGWLPFLAAVAIIFLAALPLPIAARDAPPLDKDEGTPMTGIIRAAPTLVFGVLLVAVLFSTLWALLPVYGLRNGFDEDTSALLLTVVAIGGVTLQYPIGWLGDVTNRYAVMLGCGFTCVIMALLIPFAMSSTPSVLWAVLFVLGGALIAIYTMAMAIGGERFRGVELAMLMAAFGVMWGMGALAGPLLSGWAMSVSDPHGLIATLVLAPCAWLALALWRRVGSVG
jgi:MFS family permease